MTLAGVFAVVPDSLFVRLIDAEPLVTAFWRASVAGTVVLLLLMVRQGPHCFTELRTAGWPAIVYAVTVGSTAPAFVFAVSNTSVANVVFILASMPIFAAVLSWLLLSERIGTRMILTMLAVLVGLGIIAYGSESHHLASWRGDIWALYVAAAFAAALTAARQVKAVSLIPAIPIAYLGVAVVLLPTISPLATFKQHWPLILGHGICIAVGSCLLAIGPRYIRSAEVSLLVLLESVLAPLLVWWVVGENPGSLALVGGFVVILALLLSNIYLLTTRKAPG